MVKLRIHYYGFKIISKDEFLSPAVQWLNSAATQMMVVDQNGSTADGGGFIRMRLDLPPPADTTDVRLVAGGNDPRYFVHLYTSGMILPSQYCQAGFDVTQRWSELRLPFDTFRPSGTLLRATPRPDRMTSIAIVTFGRDHEAEVDIREIGFYCPASSCTHPHLHPTCPFSERCLMRNWAAPPVLGQPDTSFDNQPHRAQAVGTAPPRPCPPLAHLVHKRMTPPQAADAATTKATPSPLSQHPDRQIHCSVWIPGVFHAD
jgi:hypothetical protein